MEKLVITPMPTVLSMLLNRERAKGTPLTEPEVLAIRDNAASIALRAEVAEALALKRGYKDLDLLNIWQSWCDFRREFPGEVKLPEAPPLD